MTPPRPKDEPKDAQPQEMWIAYMRLDVLKRAPRNPQGHDLEEIGNSTRRFGWVDPLIIDERDGAIVSGHGRLDTADGQMQRGEEPPERVRVDEDGMWMLPVVRGITFDDPLEAEAYLITANRLVDLGVDDSDILAEMLKDQRDGPGLIGTGYDDDDLDELLRDDDDGDDTSPPPGPRVAVCEPGDVWLLGTHALTVGEKADQADLICEQFQRNTKILPTRDGEEHSFIFED